MYVTTIVLPFKWMLQGRLANACVQCLEKCSDHPWNIRMTICCYLLNLRRKIIEKILKPLKKTFKNTNKNENIAFMSPYTNVFIQ